jgi:cytochrome c peroxidase
LKAAYGKYLGPVADQALNPFTNPVEQNTTRKNVCNHVKKAPYSELFDYAWGEPINCKDGLDISYKRIAVALAAYQDSEDVNSFTSKRDEALAKDEDGQFPLDDFSAQENYGHDLFYATFQRPLIVNGVRKVSNCAFCHSDNPATDTGAEPLQLYTDNGYHNIGVPPNPEIPFAGDDPDEGLAGHTGCIGTPDDPCPAVAPPFPPGAPLVEPNHIGFFKTTTLRGVDKRPKAKFPKAYTHNGWFKSLESIVHFYNTADVTNPANGKTRCPDNVTSVEAALKHNCWPAPAKPNSAIGFLLGGLGLTAKDEAAIVAYLKTFSDYHTAKPPKPHVKGKPLKPYKPIE